jgi:hypothetical protein
MPEDSQQSHGAARTVATETLAPGRDQEAAPGRRGGASLALSMTRKSRRIKASFLRLGLNSTAPSGIMRSHIRDQDACLLIPGESHSCFDRSAESIQPRLGEVQLYLGDLPTILLKEFCLPS